MVQKDDDDDEEVEQYQAEPTCEPPDKCRQRAVQVCADELLNQR